MPKWVKTIVAVLLLPLCVGGAAALWHVVRGSGQAEATWVMLLSGGACWLAIYLLLPKPMWIYVFGHELTHVIWTWIFLGRVKKFQAGSGGGHVVVTRTNFLIALAPYFFPLYAMAVACVFGAGNLAWNWEPYRIWFHLLLGAAYAFHLTLTWFILKTNQSDITSQGYLFSGVVIYLGNLTVLLLGIPLLTSKVTVLTALGWWLQSTGEFLRWAGRF